jgi:hypothetical protein
MCTACWIGTVGKLKRAACLAIVIAAPPRVPVVPVGAMVASSKQDEDATKKASDGLSPARLKMAQVPPPAPISGRAWIRSPEGPSKEQLEKDPIAGRKRCKYSFL